MKRFLLPVIALMLTSMTMNAQVAVNLPEQAQKIGLKDVSSGSKTATLKKAKVPMKAGLADNQRAYGPSGTDSPNSYFGFPADKCNQVAVGLSPAELKDYVGCKVIGMRVTFYQNPGKLDAFVATSTGLASGGFQNVEKVQTKTATNMKTATISNDGQISDLNWNYITFDTPYTIPENPDYMLYGFQYEQKSTVSGKQYTEDCYPLFIGSTTSSTGFVAYGAFGSTFAKGWYSLVFKDNQGNRMAESLCAQLILEKEGGFPSDIIMVGMGAKKYVDLASGKLPIAFGMYNIGSKAVANSTYTASIDGKEVGTVSCNEAIGSSTVIANGEVSLEGIEPGAHVVSVKLKTMDGGKPTGNLDDDETSTYFHAYTDKTDRQHNLVEHFTSVYCGYCPRGYTVLNSLTKDRSDIDWVAMHNSWFDSSNGKDEFVVEGGEYLASIAAGGDPSACINRYYINDETLNDEGRLGISLGYSSKYTDYATGLIGEQITKSVEDAPSQVSIYLTSNYNKTTGKLELTVNGQGVKNAAKVLKNASLTVYITEDGLTGDQANYDTNKMEANFAHRNVLRKIVSKFYGDEIAWDGDNFTKTYNVNIPAAWTKSLKAVAFVSTHFATENDDRYARWADLEDLAVNQCNSIAIIEGTNTAVKGVESTDGATVIARYTADGTQISAPVKGINILKMSDGTTRKVLISK